MMDFLSACRSYLLAQKPVTDLADQRVFVLALPRDEVEADAEGKSKMPRQCVVLLSSGPDSPNRRRQIGEPKVEWVCYGATDLEAAAMERPVAQAFKDLNRELVGSVLLHNATIAAGPFQARDPETGWPAMRRSAIVRADEREVL